MFRWGDNFVRADGWDNWSLGTTWDQDARVVMAQGQIGNSDMKPCPNVIVIVRTKLTILVKEVWHHKMSELG